MNILAVSVNSFPRAFLPVLNTTTASLLSYAMTPQEVNFVLANNFSNIAPPLGSLGPSGYSSGEFLIGMVPML